MIKVGRSAQSPLTLDVALLGQINIRGLVAFASLEQEIESGPVEPAAADVAMEQEQYYYCNDQEHTHTCYSQNNEIGVGDCFSNGRVPVPSQKHPYALADQVQQEEHVRQQQTQKFLIIFAADAVVEVLAVMVKLLSTASAFGAVVRSQQPLSAHLAPTQLALIDVLCQLGVTDDAVDWVMNGYPHIVVDNRNYQDKVEGAQNVQDGVLSHTALDYWREDIHDLQDDEGDVNQDGQDAEWRRSIRASIFCLVWHLQADSNYQQSMPVQLNQTVQITSQ